MSARHQPLVRCLRLAQHLQGRRYRPSLESLAGELGVTTRTVYRYLVALNEAHWPIPVPPPREYELDDAPMERRGRCDALRRASV